jgi:hypothetical protein
LNNAPLVEVALHYGGESTDAYAYVNETNLNSGRRTVPDPRIRSQSVSALFNTYCRT